ncbi:MAG TPA: zinc ribbon domain-containing protein [Gemmatimonadaceae bacterium]|nr:zinc ribbon domain-containing protein [Gemmatimonadaceae bacterium]
MPTYEYRCPNGHDFEKFYRTISASEVEVACPTCGATAVRRVSGGAGLLFKGSGFYLTDYGKNAHAKRGDAKPSSSGAEASKPDAPAPAPAKPDAKPSGGSAASASGGTSAGAAAPKPKKAD